jgi:hypothetical protein
MTTGAGILLAMVSNIFTGRDFEIAVHVARFGILWYLLIGIILTVPMLRFVFHPSLPDLEQIDARSFLVKRLLAGLLFTLLAFQMVANMNRSMPRFDAMRGEFVETQSYAEVLDWLKEEPEGVVIAPGDLNSYISTLTKQYVLYNQYAQNFAVSDGEMRERYLLYHALDRLNENQFLAGHSGYYGPAPYYLAKTSMLQYRLCVFFRDEKSCPAPKSELLFFDSDVMQNQFQTYYLNLASNIDQEYTKYNVRYIISRVSERHPLSGLTPCPIVYQDQWFEVCKLAPGS